MTDTKTYAEIEVFWDSQDPQNEGWAYRATDSDGREESGPLDAAAHDMDDAIREACQFIGANLTPDQFAREPNINGGYAHWTP